MGEKTTTAEAFLAALKPKTKLFEVPGVGLTLKLQSYTKDMQALARQEAKKNEEWNQYAFEIIVFKHGVVEPKFNDEQIGELKHNISVSVFDSIVNEIITMSELSQEESAAAEHNFLPERVEEE